MRGFDRQNGMVGTLFIDLFKDGESAPRPMIFPPDDSGQDFITFLATAFTYQFVTGSKR